MDHEVEDVLDRLTIERLQSAKTTEKPQLPWRPFKDRPTGIWIDETVQQIKETAEPDGIESLFRNQIPRDAKFRTLKHLITIDGKKRPKGDSGLPDVYAEPVPDRLPRLVS